MLEILEPVGCQFGVAHGVLDARGRPPRFYPSPVALGGKGGVPSGARAVGRVIGLPLVEIAQGGPVT
jgi:hypothetical protein